MADETTTQTAGTTNANGGGTGGKVEFTAEQQKQIDALLGERAKRAEASGANALLKELGFEKADDLKALVTDFQKRKDAEKSELEKAAAQLKKEADARATLETKYADAESKLAALNLHLAVGTQLRLANVQFVSPQAELDALELLTRGAELDEAGKVKNLETQIKTLQKERAYLFGAGTGGALGTPRARPQPRPNGAGGTQQQQQVTEPVLTL